MKKFYAFAMAGMIMLSATSLKAQNICNGIPRAVSTPISEYCVVFVQNMPPNTLVAVTNFNLQVIGTSTTDNTGFGTIVYPCDQTPIKASAISQFGTCDASVAPQAPLPVKLSSFNAALSNNNTVQLKWTSSLELSSFKYVVQKSNDGLNFSDIGEVGAAGNSMNAISYDFADNNFISGASYFRLKQVDLDGHVEYSKIVYVNNKKTAGLITSIVPNPFISDVQLIGISSAELNSKNIQIVNSFGQRVHFRVSGSNAIEIDPSAARGLYILKVKNQTFKLIKN